MARIECDILFKNIIFSLSETKITSTLNLATSRIIVSFLILASK